MKFLKDYFSKILTRMSWCIIIILSISFVNALTVTQDNVILPTSHLALGGCEGMCIHVLQNFTLLNVTTNIAVLPNAYIDILSGCDASSETIGQFPLDSTTITNFPMIENNYYVICGNETSYSGDFTYINYGGYPVSTDFFDWTGSYDTGYFDIIYARDIVSVGVSNESFYIPPQNFFITNPNCSDIKNYTLGSNDNIFINWTTSTGTNNIYYELFYTNDNMSQFTSINNNVSGLFYNFSNWNNILNVGNWKFYINATDYNNTATAFMECTFNVCQNTYQLIPEPCINNLQFIHYNDTSKCVELINLPITNGTYITCSLPPTEGENNITNAIYAIALILLLLIIMIVFKVGERK